ncbi:discoidin domain-containing protein [Actinoplanes sp. GCM10030250]|uniref:discoidin domain-containing protein n=1 Tax=Actinoplanes sp. GCM10030250 TaxID=3273376 RepID=UPI003621812C
MLAVVGPQAAQAAVLPAGFREQTVLTGLDLPMNLEFASDGRIFVAEKAGRIKVFDSIADTTPTIFADLRTNVHNQNDRGLLGLALHPDFPAQPYVYVLYTYDAPPGQTAPVWNDDCSSVGGANAGRCVVTARLSRLDAAGNETVLLHDWCQQYPSHSIGDLRFGTDGMLYLSAGDGASYNTVDYGQLGNPVNPCADPPGGSMAPPGAQGGALRSQDVRSAADPTGLSGAILRLDPVTGAAAPGNPAIGSTDANTRRIIAYGMRNPYRFALRPNSADIWVADVGWNTWEEVNRLTDSASTVRNLGWPCFEGADRQSGYDGANLDLCESLYTAGGQTGPHYAYKHSDPVVSGESCPTGGSSISGMAFAPSAGGDYPAAYRGALFFADYTRDCIWAMMPASPGGVPVASDRITFVAGASNPVDLAIGPGGDLYYADAGGTVKRIRYFAGNQPPTAALTASPTTGPSPLTVNFDATQSSDPDPADAGLLKYEWDFTNDGSVDARTATASFTYPPGGPYTARLRVLDSLDAADTQTVEIQSGNSPPVATIDSPGASTTFTVGENITFGGGATDPEQGNLPASALRWRLLQYHCYTPDNCHTHTAQEWNGVAGATFPAPDHEYPSHLELVLTATDAGGLSTTTTRRIDPRTVQLTFEGNPAGTQVTVGGTMQTTPFTRTVIQGSSNSVSGVTPQTAGGVPYVFAAWSDAGAQTHTVTAPTDNRSYTATFVRQRLVQSQMTVRSVDSQETVSQNGRGTNVLDGNTATMWHTVWTGSADPKHPHEIQLDLRGQYDVTGVHYRPRLDSYVNGRIARYEVYVSADGTNWGSAVATGAWIDSTAEQSATFGAKAGRYVRLRALSEVKGQAYTSIAELNVSVAPKLPRTALTLRSVDSAETVSQPAPGKNAIDGNNATIWHTPWTPATDPPHPHEIQLDLGRNLSVSCVYQQPRTDSYVNGRIARYEVYTSTDGSNWGSAAASGTWPNTAAEQNACFSARTARYVRVRALSEVAGQPWTSIAEIRVGGR